MIQLKKKLEVKFYIQIVFDQNFSQFCFVFGKPISWEEHSIKNIKDIENIIRKLNNMRICSGITESYTYNNSQAKYYYDDMDIIRHNECTMVLVNLYGKPKSNFKLIYIHSYIFH